LRKLIACGIAAVGFALLAAGQSASAQDGASSKCYGQIVAGIASTWPWAHDGQNEFPPPPGAIRLWLQEFGPLVGVSSVRELQQLFCDE
jgi:hypothetical protein